MSAEMILLFTYNRSDIWLNTRYWTFKSYFKNYNKKYLPPAKFINLLKKRFSPYCSVATWYLWRSRSRAYSILKPSIICICRKVVFLAIAQPA